MVGMRSIELIEGKKIYFASDQHFGAPNSVASLQREKFFLKWLLSINHDVQELFLLGDLFDFWFEWKQVVPKGYLRILGKLAEMSDSGVKIHIFAGNHDLWMKNYFEQELGCQIYFEKQEFCINNQYFLMAHGDGLGPGDLGYKRMKKIFTHPVSKWLFGALHPDWAMALGNYFSRKNKLISGDENVKFLGEDKEFLILYAKEKLKTQHWDYFIFGHRHLPMILDLQKHSKYINLGDWIDYFTYGVYDGEFQLLTFK